MAGRLAIAGLIAAAALAACVAAPRNAPAWYAERDAANLRGYPSLHDIPRTTRANTDPRYWTRVERELMAVGADVKAHDRAVPAADTGEAAQFVEDARLQLEQTRQAHTP